MYFKEQRFEKAKASTLNSTHTVELPDTGLLDTIALQFAHVNASNVIAGAPLNIWHHLTKIEVIGDTDKTLFSLTGEEAIAKAFRKMGMLPPFTHNEYGNKTQWQNIPIFFGRKFHDGHYALDLGKWDKIELKVTNDFDSTYSSSLSMETRLITIEDSTETYAKFLKQWEYEKDKPDADQDYVRPKLPTKGLLRELMIQIDPDLTSETAAPVTNVISDNFNWKLWFRDRALTIRDHRPKDLMRDEHLIRGLGPCIAPLKPYPSTSRYTDFIWGYMESIAASPIQTGDTSSYPPAFDDSQDRYQVPKNIGGGVWYQALAKGYGIFDTFAIPFYVEDLEAEYLNLDTYKPIEIEFYGYKDDCTHRVILEKPIGQGPSEYA
jgi:hypothetical protein